MVALTNLEVLFVGGGDFGDASWLVRLPNLRELGDPKMKGQYDWSNEHLHDFMVGKWW